MFKWKREEIVHLITCVQRNPCLYDVKNIEYLDRSKKALAFNNILQDMQRLESSFTLYEIKRKWKNLRTQYAQELRAINLSKKSGNTYAPKLWCFQQMDFLNKSVCIKEMKAEKNYREQRCQAMESSKLTKKEKTNISTDELLELAAKRLKKSDDYSQSVANVWASEFRQVTDEQKFFAKKAIDDIIYEARLGRLHLNSVKINQTSETFNNASDSTLEPSRITSSPDRMSQTEFSQYIVHLPSQPKSYVKCEDYSRSYTET